MFFLFQFLQLSSTVWSNCILITSNFKEVHNLGLQHFMLTLNADKHGTRFCCVLKQAILVSFMFACVWLMDWAVYKGISWYVLYPHTLELGSLHAVSLEYIAVQCSLVKSDLFQLNALTVFFCIQCITNVTL